MQIILVTLVNCYIVEYDRTNTSSFLSFSVLCAICYLLSCIVYFIGFYCMILRQTSSSSLPTLQQQLFFNPTKNIHQAYNEIYKQNRFSVGWPKGAVRRFAHLARPNTAAIVGVALGDEGKGRLVDNKLEHLLKKPKIGQAYVIRYQGGNNAGHTIEKYGVKLALHVVPSYVLHEQAFGIIDRGVLIHPEDLQTEVTYVEQKVGKITDRLSVSQDAILCSDIERAEEMLNRIKEGKAKGGTGRGISPAYAHYYEKTGLKLSDLIADDWQGRLSTYYERKAKEFDAFQHPLTEIEVPDFAATVASGKETKRTVGDKKTFLKRLGSARSWLLDRHIITDTFVLNQQIAQDKTTAILFEGAQAAGLDAWIGTVPDVTASNTSVSGVREGTAFWRMEDISERIGVFKATYTSSVGARRMPTHIDLPKDLKELTNPTPDQQWAAYVRETAHEYGTTTGRPRDITYLDLPFLIYNARMSGAEVLAGTHLDIARNDTPIKVCTHYTDQNNRVVSYQPGLQYLGGITPHYIELPGWDGALCNTAQETKQLPEHALKFLAFLEQATGYPIIAVTTGPTRDNILTFPGASLR